MRSLFFLTFAVAVSACSTPTVEVARCGDGQLGPTEVCDDGNNVSKDGCNATCTSEEYCGNGILDPGEECEDGNAASLDGCSAACAVERGTAQEAARCGDGTLDSGEQCDDNNNTPGDGCSAICTEEVCGNGILDPGEGCEDGNTTSDDGCSDTCQIEVLGACGDGTTAGDEACDDGGTVSGDGCSPWCTVEVCGNGILDPGEQCEDGGRAPGDGCSADCEIESFGSCGDGTQDAGEQCDDGANVPGDGCSALCRFEVCGNGVIDPGEACEDGNAVSGDGCSALCAVEVPRDCGDGTVTAPEQCDDGGRVAGDGCSPYCTLETCGNGILDPGELCEDGNQAGGDGCSANCQAEARGSCGDGQPNLGELCDDGGNVAGDGCSPFCTLEDCGDGVRDPGEACDDGGLVNGDGCSSTCTYEFVGGGTGYCGDGTEDANEECDDGDRLPGDGCSAVCTIEACGNGILDPGEGCEDGDRVSGDGCSSSCQIEVVSGGGGTCGNGQPDPGETCDDGGRVAGDGCSPYCTVEACGSGVLDPGEVCEDGNQVDGDGCSADCLSAEICGNNLLDPGEDCDDGDRLSGDGCSSTCQDESSDCGDGTLQPWEGCDDGGRVPGDGCSADCRIESCGDGIRQAGEECDDGNANDADNCPSTCRNARCGDSFRHATAEECDDGGNVGGDGCSATCRLEACGNGRLDAGEVCDDGNAVRTDACVDCVPAACGDGDLHVGFERCDDGNRVDGDGCSADCQSNEECGNGLIDPGEGCDDGNTSGTDGCTTDCFPAECGDGFLWAGFEGCDDDNLIDGDGCTSDCVPDGCGNGMPEGDEACDEGGANSTQGASCFETCVSAQVSFETSTLLTHVDGSFGQFPRSLAVGDVDGDGWPDLAAATEEDDGTTLFINRRDGRFAAPNRRYMGTNPNQLLVVDLDGDGFEDLITPNTSTHTLSVRWGNGTDFPVKVDVSLAARGCVQSNRVVVADVDGTGGLDLLVSCLSSNNVVRVSQASPRNLSAVATVATLGTTVRDIGFGDVTGDGVPDIVAAHNGSDTITVMPGLGGGLFAAANSFSNEVGASGVQAWKLRLVDVSGDGLKDVVVVNRGSYDITVHVADGMGGLLQPVPFPLSSTGVCTLPEDLEVVDVTQDGQPDVLVACRNDNQMVILKGVFGGATFQAPVAFATSSGNLGTQPTALQVARVDDDPYLDVLLANEGSDDITILYGDGAGGFSLAGHVTGRLNREGSTTNDVAVSDVDNDGLLDLIVLDRGSAFVMLLPGLGDGEFAIPNQLFSEDAPTEILAADLSGDGTVELVALGYLDKDVRVSVRQPSGAWTQQTTDLGTYADYPRAMSLADMNDDGNLDVCVTSLGDNGIAWTFGSAEAFDGDQARRYVAYAPSWLVMAEITQDAWPDAILVNRSGHSIEVRTGTGLSGDNTISGTPVASSTTAVGPNAGRGPVHAIVLDVDGNGFLDIVTANETSDDLTVLLAVAPAVFQAPYVVPMVPGAVSPGVRRVASGDLNGDGIIDLVSANPGNDTISYVLGFGDGMFSAPRMVPVGDEPLGLIVADLDNDGDDDIATANASADTITILRTVGHP